MTTPAKRGQFGVGDNSVSVHHYGGQFGVSSSLGTIRCQFIIIASLEGQFGVSSSLLLPLHQGQFGVSSSLLLPLRDNSVSVHHYCFPCIKSVSWIQGQFGVSRLCRLAAPGMMKMELGFGSLWLEAGVG